MLPRSCVPFDWVLRDRSYHIGVLLVVYRSAALCQIHTPGRPPAWVRHWWDFDAACSFCLIGCTCMTTAPCYFSFAMVRHALRINRVQISQPGQVTRGNKNTPHKMQLRSGQSKGWISQNSQTHESRLGVRLSASKTWQDSWRVNTPKIVLYLQSQHRMHDFFHRSNTASSELDIGWCGQHSHIGVIARSRLVGTRQGAE